MKPSFKITLAGFTLFSLIYGTTVNAVNPPRGWYGGVFLGPTMTNKITYPFKSPLTGADETGSMKYNVLGNIGVDLGYRINKFRVEGEFFYNASPYDELTIGSVVIPHTSGTDAPASASTTPPTIEDLGMKGHTYTSALLINGFYDLFSHAEGSFWAPYVGVGIGYAHIVNNIKFYDNDVAIGGSMTSSEVNKPAAQAILGINYFVDDFASFGIDFRYFATQKLEHLETGLRIASVNFTVAGSFDCAWF